jgi:putative tryptophan/tyrosine transport system substrate-binding protein
MRRREFMSMIAGAAVWPLRARAEQPAMRMIGYLTVGAAAGAEHLSPASIFAAVGAEHLIAAFRRGLAEAGYVEGKNLAIEYRFTDFRAGLMTEAAGDLVRLNMNVIFAAGPEAVAAVRNATASIPIVAVDFESDPIAKGYAKSLARPGGNMTGMFLDIPELSGKQVELLKEIVPRLSRIAIFGIPGLNAPQFATTETAVRALALEAEIMEVRVVDDFERALEAARTKHAEAGILLSSPLVFASSRQIAEFAIAKRLPLISLFGEFPKAGGFIAYGPNQTDVFRRCGNYVAKILHGAKPSDLPIQRPEKFDLVINLKTAKALGISVAPVLLATANEVIE